MADAEGVRCGEHLAAHCDAGVRGVLQHEVRPSAQVLPQHHGRRRPSAHGPAHPLFLGQSMYTHTPACIQMRKVFDPISGVGHDTPPAAPKRLHLPSITDGKANAGGVKPADDTQRVSSERFLPCLCSVKGCTVLKSIICSTEWGQSNTFLVF